MPKVDLTVGYIRSLKPPESGRIEIWDKRTPGLCLRITAAGHASWSLRYRPRNGGGYGRLTLGSLEDPTLSGARERAARHRGIIDDANPQKDRREGRATQRLGRTRMQTSLYPPGSVRAEDVCLGSENWPNRTHVCDTEHGREGRLQGAECRHAA